MWPPDLNCLACLVRVDARGAVAEVQRQEIRLQPGCSDLDPLPAPQVVEVCWGFSPPAANAEKAAPLTAPPRVRAAAIPPPPLGRGGNLFRLATPTLFSSAAIDVLCEAMRFCSKVLPREYVR